MDLDAKVLAKPSGLHSCGHCGLRTTEDVAAVCNPLAKFMPVVSNGKLAFALEKFVQETDDDLSRPPPRWTSCRD